jgi:hypothetical protein
MQETIKFVDQTGGRVIQRDDVEGEEQQYYVTASFVVTIAPDGPYATRRELVEVLAENIVSDFGEHFADMIDRVALMERVIGPALPPAAPGEEGAGDDDD